MAYLLISVQVYITALFLFFDQAGYILQALAILPAAVAGWLYGPWIGIIISGGISLFGVGLFFVTDPSTWVSQTTNAFPGYLALMFIGVFSGWLSSNFRQFRRQTDYLEEELAFRQQAEDALMASERHYRNLVEKAGDVVFLVDREGKFEYINPPGIRMSGYSPETINHMTYLELIAPEWQTKVQDFYAYQMDNRIPQTSFEFQVITKDGDIRWVQQTTNLLTDKGRITGFQGIIRDVSEQKKYEEAIAQARDEAMEANRLKSKLLATISHDIRTPLNSILGFSDLLNRAAYGEISPEQRETVELIIANTQVVSNLINNLLTQSELEQGEITLSIAPFSPAALIETIQNVVTYQIKDKGLTLTCQIDEALPDELNGDFQRLQQIVLNLVNNAVKFTQKGKIAVTIKKHDEDHWAMAVADTGPGIPEEAREDIFKPFQKVNLEDKSGQGTGLGLSIVKEYVMMMGGEITLESVLGKGSQFYITLPFI
jgi:PAS domain S-box-containing protein